jgi:peroxiredoxin
LPQIIGDTGVVEEAPIAAPGESLLEKRAPNFVLSDIDGDRTTLAQFYGVPSVVTFWATWNRDSADQVRILDDYGVNDAEQARLVNRIAINSQEDPSIVRSFIRRGSYDLHALADPFGEASSKYNIKSLPTTYFISRSGVVKDIHVGLLNERGFVEKVDNLLKQNALQ